MMEICFILASIYIIGMCATIILISVFIDKLFEEADDKVTLLLIIAILVVMSWFGLFYILNRYENS